MDPPNANAIPHSIYRQEKPPSPIRRRPEKDPEGAETFQDNSLFRQILAKRKFRNKANDRQLSLQPSG
jgi:hypothetical protein